MPVTLRRAAALLSAAVVALTAGLTAPAAADAGGQIATGVVDGVPQYRLPPGAVPAPVRPVTGSFRADYTVVLDGRERIFRLHVPSGLGGAPAPLVIGMHALYSDRHKAQELMEWDRLAAAGRFVVMYPQGHQYSWNAGRCCGRAVREGVDDVSVLVAMQRLAGRAYPIDPRRRYATGFSNGGMMALALACARPDVVAGVLVVGGGHLTPCRPGRAVPVRQVHGTADTVVPYGGTPFSDLLGTSVPPVQGTQDLWSGVNAPRGTPTELVRIVGGGHAWPRSSGTVGTPYDTTGRGWAFLRAQRNRCLPSWLQVTAPARAPLCG